MMRLAQRPHSILLLIAVVAVIGFTLSVCSENGTRPAPNVNRLSTDVYVVIADHNLIFPFIAIEDYAHSGLSFSLNRKHDKQQALDRADTFLRESSVPDRPLLLNSLSIVVGTFGLNDFDMRQRAVCPLLTREWSRSVCDNPWAAIQQALPVNRFKLLDLRDAQEALNCVGENRSWIPVPSTPGQAAIVCRAAVFTSSKNDFHTAVIRISGELGAVWTVWGFGHFTETAEAMTQREGKAIAALVQHGLGAIEDFAALHPIMCRLRRPGSPSSPSGADCPKA